MIKLTAIFTAFFRVGALTLGGGLAMLPLLRRELIAKRGWVSEEEFAQEFAMASSLPGTMIVNLALFCGANLRGRRGAAAAFLGVVLPPFFTILAVAAFLFPIFKHPSVAAFLRGAAAAVAGLLAHTAFKVCKPMATKAPLLAVAIITAGLALIPAVNPIFALMLAGAAVYYMSVNKRVKTSGGVNTANGGINDGINSINGNANGINNDNDDGDQ